MRNTNAIHRLLLLGGGDGDGDGEGRLHGTRNNDHLIVYHYWWCGGVTYHNHKQTLHPHKHHTYIYNFTQRLSEITEKTNTQIQASN